MARASNLTFDDAFRWMVSFVEGFFSHIGFTEPSVKLTANAPENESLVPRLAGVLKGAKELPPGF